MFQVYQMKKILAVSLLLLFLQHASAQFDTVAVRKNIYAGMDSMLTLFKQRNWTSYAGFMHPNLVKMMGGKQAFAAALKQQMRMLDSVQLVQYKPGNIVQLIKKGNEYQCVTESFMQMKLKGENYSSVAYDIGTSVNGKKWYYTRINESGPTGIKTIIPTLFPDLKFPNLQPQRKVTLEEFMRSYTLSFADFGPRKEIVPIKRSSQPKQ